MPSCFGRRCGGKVEDDSIITLNTGAVMPKVGLGTWAPTNLGPADQHDAQALADAVKVAVEAGYRHIDTAWAYKNEKEIGVVLKDLFDRGVVKRSELFITTKLFSFFHNPASVEDALRESLDAMQLAFVDLYLIHGPIGMKRDPERPGTIALDHYDHLETWKAMEACMDKGLVKAIGISNWNSRQIQRLLDNARIKPACLQVECHPYYPQTELKEWCQKKGIAFTAYSPIGSPGLAGSLGSDVPKLLEQPMVTAMADKYKKTPAQVLIRWAYDRGCSVIPKSTNPERIRQNFNIFDFSLSAKDIKELEGLKRGRVLGDFLAQLKDHPDYPWNDPF